MRGFFLGGRVSDNAPREVGQTAAGASPERARWRKVRTA